MIRLLLLLALLMPASALAQEPVATPTAGIEEEATPVGDEDVDDPVDDEDPVPSDGDDAYTCSEPVGTDGDYTYCSAGAGGGGPRETPPKRTVTAAAQPLPTGTLPYTGASPALIAALGLAFLLIGSGLRMRSGSSAVRARGSVSWR